MLVLTCYEVGAETVTLPNVAYLRLDKDGSEVLHKRVETGESLQTKFDLKKKETASFLKAKNIDDQNCAF